MKNLVRILCVFGFASFSLKSATAQCITAVDLDGTNQFLYGSSFLQYDFSQFTIEMWINSDDYTANDIYVNWRNGSYIALGGWAADGSFNTWAEGLSPNSINSGPGTAPTPGEWHHIAYVFDGSNQIIYIDGTAVTTVPTTGSVDLNATTQMIGLVVGARFDQGQQFTNTKFDDVRIWNSARSSTEINATMNTDLNGNESGLVAYYRFEDGVGSTIATDLTSGANHLTLTNMDPATDWMSGVFSSDIHSTATIENCGPFTWIDGNTYTTDNNTATYLYSGGAVGGCDSIVHLDLTVLDPVDNTITTSGPTFSANEVSAGTQYQWVDCDNGNTSIPGETNQTFTATQTGSYAVVITGQNGCSETSTCSNITIVGLDEINPDHLKVSIYPNPASSVLSVKGLTSDENFTILNLQGETVHNGTTNNTITVDYLASGTYLLKFENRPVVLFVKE